MGLLENVLQFSYPIAHTSRHRNGLLGPPKPLVFLVLSPILPDLNPTDIQQKLPVNFNTL